MRDSLAAPPADRVSSATSWMAWGLAGAFFTLVALPLASSSPYPTPSHQDWSLPQSQVTPASTFALASASSVPAPEGESVPLVTTVKTLSIKRPIGNQSESAADRAIVTASVAASIGGRSAEPANEPKSSVPSAPEDDDDAEDTSARPNTREIDEYLWEVYQRQPVKKDRGGDFSWKDPAAAKRMGKTLQGYVIMGMEADFRELVYHAGKAMDAAGVEWQIVSGFRDDWRQSIATGIKARTGYSRHGGSRAVGGYGHGRAIDIGNIDRDKNDDVWNWIDANGAKYGLYRPYRSFDPPHVEPRVDWRRVASRLRYDRTGIEIAEDDDTTGTAEARKPVADARPVRQKARVATSNRRPAVGRAAKNQRVTQNRVAQNRVVRSRGARGRVVTVKRQTVTVPARSAKKNDKRRRLAGG
jgi:hypothetical protein